MKRIRRNPGPAANYQKTDDSGTQQHVAALDFSSTMKTTQLGNTLCVVNPLKQKELVREWEKVDKQKQRLGDTLYQNQRHFFIKQVFEKGFNPYLERQPTDLHTTDHRKSRDSSTNHVIEHSKEHDEHVVNDYVRNNNQTTDPLFMPMIRSVTVGDLSGLTSGKDGDREQSLPNIMQKSGLLEKSQSMTNICVSKVHFDPDAKQAIEEDNDENDDAFSHAVSSEQQQDDERQEDSFGINKVIRKRKDVRLLKKHPELMFPMMQTLTNRYDPLACKDAVSEEMSRQAQMTEKRQKSTINNMGLINNTANSNRRAKTKSRRSAEDKNASKMHEQKLIQSLTVSLPQSLKDKALDQIRQMSNSEAIFEDKERKLQVVRQFSEHHHKDDTRWTRLQSSLCKTFGVNQRWRQVQSTREWVSY